MTPRTQEFVAELFELYLDLFSDDPHGVGETDLGKELENLEYVGKELGVDPWTHWTEHASPFELKRLRDIKVV